MRCNDDVRLGEAQRFERLIDRADVGVDAEVGAIFVE